MVSIFDFSIAPASMVWAKKVFDFSIAPALMVWAKKYLIFP
jgi:hypothetical protein